MGTGANASAFRARSAGTRTANAHEQPQLAGVPPGDGDLDVRSARAVGRGGDRGRREVNIGAKLLGVPRGLDGGTGERHEGRRGGKAVRDDLDGKTSAR